MGTIVMGGPQNISMDGVVQDPDGQEGFELGGWFVEHGGADLEVWREVALAEAHGRRGLAARSSELRVLRDHAGCPGPMSWPTACAPSPSTWCPPHSPSRPGATPRSWPVTRRVGDRLKAELDGEIVIPASHQFGRTLMAHGLVDEVRFVVFPVALGAGERFFADGVTTPLRLVESRRIGEGLVSLTYRPVPTDDPRPRFRRRRPPGGHVTGPGGRPPRGGCRPAGAARLR